MKHIALEDADATFLAVLMNAEEERFRRLASQQEEGAGPIVCAIYRVQKALVAANVEGAKTI